MLSTQGKGCNRQMTEILKPSERQTSNYGRIREREREKKKRGKKEKKRQSIAIGGLKILMSRLLCSHHLKR